MKGSPCPRCGYLLVEAGICTHCNWAGCAEAGEAAGREPIRREIAIPGKQRLFLTLASHGMEVWLGHSDWPHGFPLPVEPEQTWEAIKEAIGSILAEAERRAKMENAFQQLIDPIDGPDGEA